MIRGSNLDYVKKNKVTEVELEDIYYKEDDNSNLNVEETLQKLPPHYREILILKYIGGYSNFEISEIMKIPIETVKTRLSRSKHLFRGLYERS